MKEITPQKSVLTAAVLIALASSQASAQNTPPASASEVQTLKQTVEDLRRQVEALRATSKGTAPAEPAEGESQEAVDARTPATKADVVGLRADIESYKYEQARAQERNIPSVTRNTRIGGGVTLRFDSRSPSEEPGTSAIGTTPAESRAAGFATPQFTLNFTGNLYRDYSEGRNLTYRLSFSNNASASSSSATTDATNVVNATDAYIRYSYQPATGNVEDPLGTVTLGQQVVPFGLDAQALDPEVKAVIGNAGFVSGLGLNKRQVGVAIQGDFEPYVDFSNNYRAPLVSYALGVYNGNGPNRVDNNNHRDLVARLAYTAPVDYNSWWRQIQIGSSFYLGKPTLGATNGYSANNVIGRSTRRGFDVNWTHLPFSIAYEWAYGKDKVLANDALVTTGKNPDAIVRGVGQYINLGYTWGEQFLSSSRQQGKYDDYWPQSYQAFIRFDQWDPNRSAKVINDKQYVTTVGLNVFFAETTKFQVNYLRTRNQLGSSAPTAARPKASNGLQAQFNATF
jgi:phosphate-selective porin